MVYGKRSRPRRTAATAGLAAAVMLGVSLGPAAAVAGGVISEFPLTTADSRPLGMATGPDGNLWVTETAGHKVAKISPAGAVLAEYPIPGDHPYPVGITTGSDGNLWIGDAGESRIGRMTLDGVFTGFPVPLAEPAAIAAGPDGNLWFTDFSEAKIGKISTAGVLLGEYSITSPAIEIVAGPDGNMWVTEGAANKVGKLSLAGDLLAEFTPPTAGAFPNGIIAGVDGNMWFTEKNANAIAKMTMGGVTTEYPIPTPASGPSRINVGSDGSMWFAELSANKVAKVTTSGAFTEYPIASPASEPGGTTPGPDGNVWLTQSAASSVAMVTVGAAGPAVSSVGLTSASVAAPVYPGAATATSVIQCAADSAFTSGVIENAALAGSPSSSSSETAVRGACTGLSPASDYFTRIKSTYTVPAGGPAVTNTLYTTTAAFRTLAKQTPRKNCVLVPPKSGPRKITPNSLTRLTKRHCVTNAGQPVTVRGQSTLRGDVPAPRVFKKAGSWWLRTYETPTRTRLVWSARGTSAYAPFSKAVTRNT